MKILRIITVNLPVSYLKAIDSLTGQKGLYPSRSELIRVAVRDFLIHEIAAAQNFQKSHQKNQNNQISVRVRSQPKSIDENLFVQVPVNDSPIEGVTEYKTYRLVKR